MLKVLLKGSVRERELIFKIKEQPTAEDEDRYAAALASMVKEGLIEHGAATQHGEAILRLS
jgi:hypothetical protein